MNLNFKLISDESFDLMVNRARLNIRRAENSIFTIPFSNMFSRMDNLDLLLFGVIHKVIDANTESWIMQRAMRKYESEYEKRFKHSNMIYELAKHGIIVSESALGLSERPVCNEYSDMQMCNVTRANAYINKHGLYIDVVAKDVPLYMNKETDKSTAVVAINMDIEDGPILHKWQSTYSLLHNCMEHFGGQHLNLPEYMTPNSPNLDLDNMLKFIRWHADIHEMSLYQYSLGYADFLTKRLLQNTACLNLSAYLSLLTDSTSLELAKMLSASASEMVDLVFQKNVDIKNEILPEIGIECSL